MDQQQSLVAPVVSLERWWRCHHLLAKSRYLGGQRFRVRNDVQIDNVTLGERPCLFLRQV